MFFPPVAVVVLQFVYYIIRLSFFVFIDHVSQEFCEASLLLNLFRARLILDLTDFSHLGFSSVTLTFLGGQI